MLKALPSPLGATAQVLTSKGKEAKIQTRDCDWFPGIQWLVSCYLVETCSDSPSANV